MVPTVSFTTATTSRSNSCRGMGLRGLFLEDTACYVCSHDWERTCLLSVGVLQAAAPCVCKWMLKPQNTSSMTQLQRSWHAGTALPGTAPRAGALGGLR